MTSPTSSTPTRVLFIAGHGRSGSTLLDRVLGESPGFFSGGELRHIWHRSFTADQLCGCGEAFSGCEFWREASRSAYGPGGPDVDEILRLKHRVDRWWRSPEIASPWKRAAFAADLDAYIAHVIPLYRGIAEVSGAGMIVDSTKDVSHGYVLAASDDIELHVVHLVRDSRASAHSWRRHKFDPGKARELDRYNVVKAAAGWSASHALASGFRYVADSYQLVHYRDFASDPAATVAGILDRVGRPGGSQVAADRSVDLGVAHTVAGNPVRFHRGRVEIRPDEEWRERLPWPAKAVVTTLTGPVLLATGTTAHRS